MRHLALTLLPALVIGGCAQVPILDRFQRDDSATPVSSTEAAPVDVVVTETLPEAGDTVTAPPASVTATPESLDTVSEAAKQRAQVEADVAAAAGPLGTATVTLGDPAEAGLWVKTSLVSAETTGTVTAENGEAITVTLRPLGGAGGDQISLSALQALGLQIVGLHRVTLSRS